MFFPDGLVPQAFDREMGCSEADWLRWLPEAVLPHVLQLAVGGAVVLLHEKPKDWRLHLKWMVLPARRIALLEISRLAVSFQFEGPGDRERADFMRRFDLTMQRGGG